MIFRLKNDLVGIIAPEFQDELTWINSKPLKLQNLLKQKKLILVDFWTYSCVNCIRTLPHIKEWDEKYRDKGLVIIGVHTPEFNFEKNIKNIKRAVKDFNLKYPIVVDSDYKIWNAWGNNVWPRKFLINIRGRVIYDHRGEGGYAETELAIQGALHKISKGDINLPRVKEDTNGEGSVCYPATAETYLGSLRGREGVDWFLVGSWKQSDEYIQHSSNTKEYIDYLLLKYEAISVNIVMQSTEGSTGSTSLPQAKIKVELNNKPVPKEKRGQDLIEKDGQTYILVSTPRMYNIISNEEFHKGALRLYANTDNIQLYAFTFSACEGVHV